MQDIKYDMWNMVPKQVNQRIHYFSMYENDAIVLSKYSILIQMRTLVKVTIYHQLFEDSDFEK